MTYFKQPIRTFKTSLVLDHRELIPVMFGESQIKGISGVKLTAVEGRSQKTTQSIKYEKKTTHTVYVKTFNTFYVELIIQLSKENNGIAAARINTCYVYLLNR